MPQLSSSRLLSALGAFAVLVPAKETSQPQKDANLVSISQCDKYSGLHSICLHLTFNATPSAKHVELSEFVVGEPLRELRGSTREGAHWGPKELGWRPNAKNFDKHGVQCKAWTPINDTRRTTQPAVLEFLGETLQYCDPTKECFYMILNLDIDTQYEVFCVDWGTILSFKIPQVNIVPPCPHPCALVANTASSYSGSKDLFGATDLAIVLLVMGYASWSFFFLRIPLIHETALAVLLGLLGGLFLKYAYKKDVGFSYETFSYFILPMVIFQAGFCLQRRNFFRFAPYIMTLGLVGTIITFLLNYYISGYFSVSEQLRDGSFVTVTLTRTSRLKMAAVMASTDTVAPMAFINQGLYPGLYAVVFGEGILNDVVSVLLSASVEDAQTLPPMSELIGNIAKFLFASAVLGICFGILTCVMFKYFRALREDVVKSSVLLLGANYSCYIIGEMIGVSPIFALFVCALLCGHYGRYSLSSHGKAFMREMAELMAYVAEAMVFAYFGLTAVRYFHDFHMSMILRYTACIFGGRLVAVLVMVFAAHLLSGFRRGLSLTYRELVVVWLAGCIRGTIAYALILRAVPSSDSDMNPQEKVMVSTVLGIVLSNCLLVGTLFPLTMKFLRLAEPIEIVSPHACSARRAFRRGWHHYDEVYFKPWLRPAGWHETVTPFGNMHHDGSFGGASMGVSMAPAACEDLAETATLVLVDEASTPRRAVSPLLPASALHNVQLVAVGDKAYKISLKVGPTSGAAEALPSDIKDAVADGSVSAASMRAPPHQSQRLEPDRPSTTTDSS